MNFLPKPEEELLYFGGSCEQFQFGHDYLPNSVDSIVLNLREVEPDFVNQPEYN